MQSNDGKFCRTLASQLTLSPPHLQERKEATKLFPTDEVAREAANSSHTFEPDEDLKAAEAQAGVSTNKDADMADAATAEPSKKATAQQLLAVKAAIANAATLEEIQRLEAALTSGQLPSQFDSDTNGGTEAMQEG